MRWVIQNINTYLKNNFNNCFKYNNRALKNSFQEPLVQRGSIVPSTGFEPVTAGAEIQCSIQLSQEGFTLLYLLLRYR